MNWIAKLSTGSEVDDQKNDISECTGTDAPKPLKPVEPFLKPCPLCRGMDFIHPDQGGYFCLICQHGHTGKPVKAGLSRTEPNTVTGYPCGKCGNRKYRSAPDGYQMPGDGPVDGWECTGCCSVFLLCGNKPVDVRHKRERTTRVSGTALAWLQDHRQELRAAGWTPAELYRRNKSKGLAWVTTWDRPDLTVTLSLDGSINFRYVNETGSPITQRAFPRRK